MGLHSEIGLSKGYLWLAWVAVLSYEITGITGEHDVFHLSLCSRTQVDHFADVSKIVGCRLPCIVTGFLCFVNYITEITPVCSIVCCWHKISIII